MNNFDDFENWVAQRNAKSRAAAREFNTMLASIASIGVILILCVFALIAMGWRPC